MKKFAQKILLAFMVMAVLFLDCREIYAVDIHGEIVENTPFLVIAPNETNPMETCLKELTRYPLENLDYTFRAGADYETLLKIVEAEAGGETAEGKILVANVILNRIASQEYPDTVQEVVYQEVGGSPQFTPTADGRIDTVTVTQDTVEAVDRALDGEDNSDGALYFLAKRNSDDGNVSWFDKNLTWLFTCGGHDFYR